MWRVTVKGLLAHKLRLVLTALAVTLGVAFMAGTLVLTDTIRRTFDDLFADVNAGTDVFVRSRASLESDFGPETRARVPATLVDAIQEVEGARAAEGELQFYAQLVDDDGEAVGNPGFGPPTFGFNWGEVDALNAFRILPGGRAPAAGDEVVVDRASADEAGFEVGDRIEILTQRPPKRYEVVGIATFGEADSPAGASAALFSTPEAQRITGAPGQFDAIAVVGAPGVSQAALRDRVRAALDDPSLQVLTGAEITEEDQEGIADLVGFIRTPLLVFAGVALLVGSFLIFNTFSILVSQRTRETALLRAVGAGGGQVTGSLLAESAVVGLLASLAGLVAGVALSAALKALLDVFGFDVPAGGLVVSPATVVITLGVGTIVTLVSAAVPAVRAARVPPVAALRDVAVERPSPPGRRIAVGVVLSLAGVTLALLGLYGDFDRGLYMVGIGALALFVGVAVLGPVIARPFTRFVGAPLPRLRGFRGTLARENAMRNPRRTSATAAALMIGIAIVVFFTVFAASGKRSIDAQIDPIFEADYVVSTGFGFAGFGAFSPALAENLTALPEVALATGMRFGSIAVVGPEGDEDDFVAAFDPATIEQTFELDPRVGRLADLGDDGLAVSEEAAGDHGWDVGDTVVVRFPNGERRLRVQVIYANGFDRGISDYSISLAAYEASYPDQLDALVFVDLASGVDRAEGEVALEGALEAYPNAELQDREEFKAAAAAQINQLLALIFVLLFLAVLIAVIGIANTLALSVSERTHEIGLLRAVGMSRRQLRSAIRWESVLIALLGATLGLVLGVCFAWAVARSLVDDGFTEFVAAPGQLALIVVASGFAGVVAGVFPARRAAKLDVLRAISSE